MNTHLFCTVDIDVRCDIFFKTNVIKGAKFAGQRMTKKSSRHLRMIIFRIFSLTWAWLNIQIWCSFSIRNFGAASCCLLFQCFVEWASIDTLEQRVWKKVCWTWCAFHVVFCRGICMFGWSMRIETIPEMCPNQLYRKSNHRSKCSYH